MSEAYLLLFDKYSNSSLVVDTTDEYVLGSVGYFTYLPTLLGTCISCFLFYLFCSST